MKKYVNGTYIEMSEEEIAEYVKSMELSPAEKIAHLKKKLSDTDYKILKLTEGALSLEECADVIKQRAEWRKEINLLEKEVK
jgi:hypothetical protein